MRQEHLSCGSLAKKRILRSLKEVEWSQHHLCLAVAERQILGTSSFWTRVWKDLVVEKGAISPEKKVPLPMDPLAWQETQVEFLCRHSFDFIGVSYQPRVSEWSPRTAKSALGDCISRAKVIPVQAPQCRQYALISDFLDLAHLRFREGAALATNWIKDRLEVRALSSLPRNLTADVQYAFHKCESLPRQQLILHGNPSATARDFSPHVAVL